MLPADVLARHNIRITGHGTTTLLFAHGFGCDQSMWRLVAPAFADDARVVVFDYIGAGGSDHRLYDSARYNGLQGYADDVVALIEALGGTPVRLVAHSVSSMIGVLAAIARPDLFDALILVCPSPRYIDDGPYVGGFARADIEGLLELMDRNPLGWAGVLAPMVMQRPDRPELTAELEQLFCSMDRDAAREFAAVTFLADNRADLPRLGTPSLILQCAADRIAPASVGEYMHEHMADSQIVYMRATGHCPQLSAPEETIAVIRAYLATRTPTG
jgi:sigma-B regulation protein RsbQ